MAKTTSGNTKRAWPLGSWLSIKTVLWAGAALLLSAAVCAGAHAIWRQIALQPAFRVDASAFAPGQYPEYVNGPRMTQEIRGLLARVPRGQSIFDKALAPVVARELGRSPWVFRVISVNRALPNSLEARIVFRKPGGLVSVGGRCYMIDVQGHWLPEGLFRQPRGWRGEHIPVIVDQMLRTPPRPGQAWDGPRLAVGARLSEFFRENGLLKKLDVATIDVTGVGRAREPEIVLTTADGAQIKWGKSSVYGLVGGLQRPAFLIPDRDKLAMLLSKLNDHPGLKGIHYVDLRFRGQVVFAEGK